MGWLFGSNWTTRKGMIDHLTKDRENSLENGRKVRMRCLAKTFKGAPWAGVLYAVFENIYVEPDGQERSERWIGVFKLRYSKDDFSGCWGYKDMEESMGPCYYGCPLSYLEMVPCPDSQYAREWREQVHEYWKAQAERRKKRRVLVS